MTADQPQTVILLHGLMRGKGSMEGLGRYITQVTGLEAVSLAYPSSSGSIDQLASNLNQLVRQQVGSGAAFAVTHSLGGIVLRHMVGLPDQVDWKGCVMIAPPNRGSAVARTLGALPGIGGVFGFFWGQAGLDLGAEVARVAAWPPPPQPCGVIAGTSSLTVINPVSWMSNAFSLLPTPNDGTVAVEETRLDAEHMTDFATVHAGHTFLMNHPDTQRLVVNFIMNGRFNRFGTFQM